eukprot:GHVH01017096.1.p1 GENE.GHVH01017096.1~~GHVH01017096.1.p1  ORF type:complete len:845 (+),score=80.25 GHVH01017096.1:53-2587(+)
MSRLDNSRKALLSKQDDHARHDRSVRFHGGAESETPPRNRKTNSRPCSSLSNSISPLSEVREEKTGKSLWANLKKAREASTKIECDIGVDSMKRNKASHVLRKDDPTSKIMMMAKLLKQQQVDRQAAEISNYFIDTLRSKHIQTNKLYQTLHSRNWLLNARFNCKADPESNGALATKDSIFIRYTFFTLMATYGFFSKVVDNLPVRSDNPVIHVLMLVELFEFFGCMIGGIAGDIVGRCKVVIFGAWILMIGSASSSILIFFSVSLWTENTVIEPFDTISLALYFSGLGCTIMVPCAMVIAVECSAHINREYILCIGFLCQALGCTLCELLFFIIAYFDLTDSFNLVALKLEPDVSTAVHRLRTTRLSGQSYHEEYTNIWPLICVGTFTVFLVSAVTIVIALSHNMFEESYLWKNKSFWLCDIDQNEMRALIDQSHRQHLIKQFADDPMSVLIPSTLESAVGVSSPESFDDIVKNEPIEDSSDESSSYTERSAVVNNSATLSVDCLSQSLLQSTLSRNCAPITLTRQSTSPIVTPSKNLDTSFWRTISNSLLLFQCIAAQKLKLMKTYFAGLHEYVLKSGALVRHEIFTLMVVPFVLYSMSFSNIQYSDIFLKLPPHSNLFPVRHFHYQLLLSLLSVPAYFICTTILLVHSPKFLQLVSLVCSAFIYFGLALSLFGIDGINNGLHSTLRLKDFYYSALCYDAIFQYGLFIPMVSCFIMPIERSHTRVRTTILGLTMASARLGSITSIVIISRMPTDEPHRVIVLLIVCTACLGMAYLTKACVPVEHVSQYDMPELHTIDLHLDKRFPERKRILVQEQIRKRMDENASFSGLYTLTAHSLASRLQ